MTALTSREVKKEKEKTTRTVDTHLLVHCVLQAENPNVQIRVLAGDSGQEHATAARTGEKKQSSLNHRPAAALGGQMKKAAWKEEHCKKLHFKSDLLRLC